jgi:ubiquinone biosynthesis UbiH/UbiF/VisC/COQ6 family hydroxylase
MNAEVQKYDVVIVGAGPSGLSFAASLRDLPLRIALIERLGEATLADPPYDGREIALTQRSARLLRELGIWERFPAEDLSPLRGARVLNSTMPDGLELLPKGPKAAVDLGYLISNHHIRRAAYENVRGQANLTLLADSEVESVATDDAGGRVTLSGGRMLEARLIVAADTRFSSTRRAMGIPARHQDFGKSMLVCCMQHERAHDHIACEWFGDHQTLAVLPMNGKRASIVLTLRHADVERLRQMPAAGFEREMNRRLNDRLGPMTLQSERYTYPLVAVYPERFHATRYVVIGDAAVGMHPVTAHGFNFGLRGAHTLAGLLSNACSRRQDIGATRLLAEYDRQHRRATRPLYLATNAVVGLYTADSPPARFLRRALMTVASRTPPIASLLSALLMEDSAALRR